MADNDIIKELRERFSDYSEPVDEACWSSVENSLNLLLQRRKRRALYYRISSLAAAAVILFGIILFRKPLTHLPSEGERMAVVVENGFLIPTEIDEKSISMAEKVKGFVAVTKKREATAVESRKTEEPEEAVAEERVSKENAVEESNADGVAKKRSEEKKNINEERAVKKSTAKERKSGSGFASFSVNSSFIGGGASSADGSTILALVPAPPGTGNGHSSICYAESIERISEVDYSMPLNVGVQVQLHLGKGFALGVGVSYSMLKSRYEGLINKMYYDVDQTLHYIGVPVNLYISIMERKNFYLYANVGGTIEKGVRASYKLTGYGENVRRFKDNIDGVQYSLNGGLGLEYMFARNFGIYLEPNLAYYFNSNVPASIRTAQPLQVKADIGLRFHLK